MNKLGLLLSVLVVLGSLLLIQSQQPSVAEGRSGHGDGEKTLSKAKPFNPFVDKPRPTPSGIREYTLVAEERVYEVFPGVTIEGWTLNGTVPGPTIVALEGEVVRVKLVNNARRPHTLHFHGIHQVQYDGVHEIVYPGQSYVYELEAYPPGLYLYHSHVLPTAASANRGFFGAFIVYPKEELTPAKELVIFMSQIDTDGDNEAEFYAFNGVANQYFNFPIIIEAGELVRVYLIAFNLEATAAFHIHGNYFKLYRSPINWHKDSPDYTDVVGLSWGERAVLEFSYKYPGLWMFHDHIAEHFEQGMVGWFKVTPSKGE